MLENFFRTFYAAIFLTPITKLLILCKLRSPHPLTLLGGIIGIAAALSLYAEFTTAAIVLLLLSGYFDSLDGHFARATNTHSDKGTVLDIFMDRVVEFAMIMALFSLNTVGRSSLSLLMLGSILLCITSFLLVGIFEKNQSAKGFHYSRGLIERPEAFGFFIAMILWPSGFVLLAWIFSLLTLYTALRRLQQFWCY